MNARNGRPTTQELHDRIVRDPAVLGGKPIIRGTRVPVYLILGFLENGQTPEEIVDDYPDLTVEDIDAVIAYADTAPDLVDQHAR
jgi:uncharacterized protein (DUF433 family)